MDTNVVLAGLVIVLLIAIGVWLLLRKKQSQALERRFGPEYGRAVEEMGDRNKAEAELLARQKRVARLHIVALSPDDAQHFTEAWRNLQSRFVDSPQGVLGEADRLVRELMQKRGYPMGDFESRAADISVDHPQVVSHYRAAHAIAELDRQESADTERLRQAVIHYRALFAELLETADDPGTTRRPHEARSPS
jgi:hypothetical protein